MSFRQTAEFTNIGDRFYVWHESHIFSFLVSEDPTRKEDITNIDRISQIYPRGT